MDRYLRPPHRCCGISTRKVALSTPGNKGIFSYICDVCAWSYRKDGTRRPNNGRLKKHEAYEVDR